MAKIRYTGPRPHRHRTLGGGIFRIPNNATIEIKEDEEVERLLAKGNDFCLEDDQPNAKATPLPQPKTSRRPGRKPKEAKVKKSKFPKPPNPLKPTKAEEHGGIPCMRAHPGKSHKDWNSSTKDKTEVLREEAKKKLKEL